MATPKKSKNKAKKTQPRKAAATKNSAQKTQAAETQQPSGGSKKTLAIVMAVLAGILLVGYFVFGLNPFESESDSTQQNDEKVTAPDKEKSTKDDIRKADEAAANNATSQPNTSGTVETVASETETTYRYATGTGESLTTLARRAVAQADNSLSTAERVAAETRLVQATDGELLNVSQDVQFSKADVQSAVAWAKSLSDQAKAAWQPYADMVAW